MYYVLYYKDFKAIGKRKSYPVSSWSLRRKAFEFSELKIEGYPIESTDGACYVGLHEDRGSNQSFDVFRCTKRKVGNGD